MVDKLPFIESYFMIDFFYNIMLFSKRHNVTKKFKARKKVKKYYVLLDLTGGVIKYAKENQPYKNKM